MSKRHQQPGDMNNNSKHKHENNETLANGSASQKIVNGELHVDNHASFAELNSLVKQIVESSSWWELYGIDLFLLLLSFVIFFFGFYLMGSALKLVFISGFLLTAYAHAMFSIKLGHSAVHNSLAGSSRPWNWFFNVLLVEIFGGFTTEGADEAHIKLHHPYTNVIGFGDSSSWRAPFLDRYTYLFIAPNFLPFIYPLVSQTLIPNRWTLRVRLVLGHCCGFLLYFSLLRYVSGLSIPAALLGVWLIRGLFAVPYIHVNIFQHIGLPMYDINARPPRLHQMASGVLNLNRNLILDYSFGHSLISCHVEHHLFPRLSDNMCLKIKPVVRHYIKSHGLPYHEGTYKDLLSKFYNEYEELMVNAPPITKFVGFQ